MGLYPQPNKWQCGPFALKHALIMLGKIVNERDVSRLAGSHWWGGTDDIKLARAARAYDCDMRMVRRTNPLRAKRELLLALKRGYPSLLCVDGWGHWITVVGAERGKFIYVDSSAAPVIRVDSWRGLKQRWVYSEVDSDDPTEMKRLYDLHPVVPRFRVRTKARFSLKRARYLRRPENRSFATNWDEYFTDLTAICTPRTPRSAKVFPLGELLRRHGTMIRSQIEFWHGGVTFKQILRIMRNLKFVADTYDLVVREEDEKRAIAAITTNLTLWAAGKYGVNPVYGEG
jgi:chorismate-pyruvate lyase